MDKYRTSIENSSVHGKGLFSQEFIPQCSLILISHVIDASGLARGKLANHVFSITGKLLLPVNKLTMINESKDLANCKVYYRESCIYLESLTDIKEGEELLIRYGKLDVHTK